MKFRALNIVITFVLICIGTALASESSQVSAQTKSSAPEATVKAFYNGYIRAMNNKVEPLAKNSSLRRHLSALLTMKKIEAFENKTEADYFFQSQEYFDDWENKFTVSEAAIKGTLASVIVTFPGGYPRVKVTLKQEAGVWKISSVQDASR